MRVTNLTGHKLPSGYPEGRRIRLNVRFFGSDGKLVREHGAYHYAEARLDIASTTVLETKLASNLLGEGETFHFAPGDSVAKDNRVPARGAAAPWTDVTYPKPGEATHAEVRLYYQTASREYTEFLRNENRTNNAGQVLYSL